MPSGFIAQFTGLEKKVHLFCKLIPLYCGVNSLQTIKERETKHMVIHLELSNLKGVSKIHCLCTGLTEYFKSGYIYIYIPIKKVLLGKLANNSVSLSGCLGVLLKSMKTHLSNKRNIRKQYTQILHSHPC